MNLPVIKNGEWFDPEKYNGFGEFEAKTPVSTSLVVPYLRNKARFDYESTLALTHP